MSVFENESLLCDYGCGKEASYTFKNGTRCCSKYPVQCEAVREKISNSLKRYHERNKKVKYEVESCRETNFFE